MQVWYYPCHCLCTCQDIDNLAAGYFVSYTVLYSLESPGDDSLWVPYEILPDLIGSLFQRADERQSFVEAVSRDIWHVLFEQAWAYAIVLDGPTR